MRRKLQIVAPRQIKAQFVQKKQPNLLKISADRAERSAEKSQRIYEKMIAK